MSRKSTKVPVAELRGKRIILRPPTVADYREYAGLMKISQPFFRELLGKFRGRKQFNDYLQRCEREDFYGFLICRREDGAILGNMNLFHLIRRSVQSVTTGYFIGAPHVRQGYATEALQLVQRFAFRNLKLHRIEASIQPHNKASIALVKRAGFTLEGYSRRLVKIAGKWRDHERWALLAEDWRPTIGARDPERSR
jgi:ribosomal-protein-alanine N-acetyltransferase